MKDYLLLKSDGEFVELNSEDYSSTYDMLRENVQGYIECVSWLPMSFERNIDLWINEEGKLLGFPPSIAIFDGNEELIDLIAGNVVFARNDNYGETIPLQPGDVEYIKETLKRYTLVYHSIKNRILKKEIRATKI